MGDWLLATDTLLFRIGGIAILALSMMAIGLFALRALHVARRWWRNRRG